MDTKEDFRHTLRLIGFSTKVVESIISRVRDISDMEDVLSLIMAVPKGTKDKTILDYVDIITCENKGEQYETIYF